MEFLCAHLAPHGAHDPEITWSHVPKLIGSCIQIHACLHHAYSLCLPDPKHLLNPSGVSLCLPIDQIIFFLQPLIISTSETIQVQCYSYSYTATFCRKYELETFNIAGECAAT